MHVMCHMSMISYLPITRPRVDMHLVSPPF